MKELNLRQEKALYKKIILLFCSLCTVYASTALTAEALWVTPTFTASVPEKKTFIVETEFNYHLYTPDKGHNKVNLVLRKYASQESVEQSFISRMSAISSVNYKWWLDTWHSDSKKLALQYYQDKGLDQEYWEGVWKQKFVGRKIKLKHKVDYNGYIILVYNVSKPNGTESYLDFPIVFKKENDKWLVSLDLRKNPLLRYSPWVEGISSEKVIYE
jgi:hypothetical protein